MKNISRISFAAVLFALASMAAAAQVKLAIASPSDGVAVEERPIVHGTVSDPKASVWIVVHPRDVGEHWVQPRVTVRDDGSWEVQIYIGRPGTADIGKRFEIRAVVSPTVELKEGMTLDSWPESAAMSSVVEVTRR